MNKLTEEYLKRGFTDIVSIERNETESADSYGTEKTAQVVVAKRGPEFVRASGFEKRTFGPNGRFHAEITVERQITHQEYEIVANGKAVLDSATIRHAFETRKAGLQQARSLKDKLESEAPNCPVHSEPMKLAGGSNPYFFGCRRYPRCSQKHWLTKAQKARANKARYLANVLD